MPLPSWLGAKRHAALAPVEMELGDSVHTAPGWRLIADDFYTCVQPADRPIDVNVLRRIHSFDPGLIPIWRKQFYLPPRSVRPIIVTHHGLARHVASSRGVMQGFHVEMPSNPTHPRPNLLELIWTEELDDPDGGPGPFWPFDMELYHFLRERFNRNRAAVDPVAAMKARILEIKEQRERAREAFRASMRERKERLDRKLQPRFEKVTHSDWREYWGRASGINRTPKPYVFHGKGAGR